MCFTIFKNILKGIVIACPFEAECTRHVEKCAMTVTHTEDGRKERGRIDSGR